MIPLATGTPPFIDPELAKRYADRQAQVPQAAQVPIPAQATKEPAAQTPIPKTQVATGNTTAQLQFPAVNSPIPKVQLGPEQQGNLDRLQHIQSTGPGASQVKNPIGRVAAGIGDALVSGLLPRFAPYIPGTTAHHNALLGQAETAVKNDQTESENEDRRRLQQAQAENQEAEAHARLNPTAKEGTPHTITTDKGIMQFNPETQRFDIPVGQAPAKEEMEGKTVTTDQGVMQWDPKTHGYTVRVGGAPEKEPAEKALQDENGNWFAPGPNHTMVPITVNGQPFKGKVSEKSESSEEKDIAEYQRTHQGATRMQAERALAINKHVETADHGMTGIDPNTGDVIRLKPGQKAPVGFMTLQQAGAQNAPTTQMRNVAAQAQLVHEQTPHMLSELDRLQNKLGPMAGRWNEVMQGKVGMDDPDFAGLRADLLMYSSAVALMHARGRLPENLREEFDRTINNPGQNFQNLKAVIQRVDDWTAKNQQTMGGKPVNQGTQGTAAETPNTGQGGYQIGHKYGGLTYQGGDPNKRESWK